MTKFELRRLSDACVYEFVKVAPKVFARMDNPRMTIAWEGPWGWVARDPDTQAIAGRPWEILPQHQQDQHPTRGLWISRKGSQSYAYDLVPI